MPLRRQRLDPPATLFIVATECCDAPLRGTMGERFRPTRNESSDSHLFTESEQSQPVEGYEHGRSLVADDREG